MNKPYDLRSLFPEEIKEIMKAEGLESYRGAQIFRWLGRGASSFDEMTDLPKSLREQAKEIFRLDSAEMVQCLRSRLDETAKYLFRLQDGEMVESVLLSYKHGYSVCLSTQVGCKMGCRFCASTKAGFVRNLTAGEILLQMKEITSDQRKIHPDFRIGHVVLMGIGEPLDNYDQVIRFLKLCNHKDLFGIGYRNISLSTCGLLPQIERLMDEDLPITLSVSLHASNSAMRSELMPINRTYPLEKLIPLCKTYTKRTGRRISFEYAVIAGVNDSPKQAKELIGLLGGWMNHLNLIPVNPTKETDFQPADRASMLRFLKLLEQGGINATFRRTLGADIQAACGQLRRNSQKQTQ